MSEITELLERARGGDRASLDRIFAQLYSDLRRMAAQGAAGHGVTLSPTALVNELYLRFNNGRSIDLSDRLHFLLTAAKAMRGLALDHARAAHAQKRGGGLTHDALTENLVEPGGEVVDLLTLDQALARLGAVDAGLLETVELHHFAGLDFVEIAALRQVNERTVRRAWQRARAFLAAQLSGSATL